jgi:hypothetical protein
MVKELIKVTLTVFITTLLLYPISSIVADIMTAIMPVNLLNTILITVVRYLGFFLGIGLVMYLYRGQNTAQYTQMPQGGY